MHPFMAAELLGFSLEDALSFGTLPLVVMPENRQDVLNAYVNLYLDEEVKMESLTRNVDSFVRFLEARSVSQILRLSNLTFKFLMTCCFHSLCLFLSDDPRERRGLTGSSISLTLEYFSLYVRADH